MSNAPDSELAPTARTLMSPTASSLAVRRVAIDTYRENVAYLHRDCSAYRAEGFQALSKVEVRANGRHILATLNVVDDAALVACHELGLSEDAFAQLDVENGHTVSISQAEAPLSIEALHRKIAGERLGREDFGSIMRDIADHRYSKIELSAFVVATSRNELDREEVYFLTEAMVACGRKFDWHDSLVVDKHCIGGLPGNRTSMLVVPIVAAHGMLCPKTSSRAITSPAGTADTMEVLANVELPFDRLAEIVREQARVNIIAAASGAADEQGDALAAIEIRDVVGADGGRRDEREAGDENSARRAFRHGLSSPGESPAQLNPGSRGLASERNLRRLLHDARGHGT